MELKAKKIREVREDKEKMTGKTVYTTYFEGKGGTMTFKEKENCSFNPGDVWEFKPVQTQRTL